MRRSDDDFAAAFEQALSLLERRVGAACAERPVPAAVAAAIRAAFDLAAEQPRAVGCLTMEALSRGEPGQAMYREMIARFASRLRACTERFEGHPADRPSVAEEAIVGGIGMLIGSRLRGNREAELAEAAVEAAQFALTAYVGVEEARRIARGEDEGSAGGASDETVERSPERDSNS